MRSRFTVFACLIIALVALAPVQFATAQAQKDKSQKVIELKGSKSAATRGAEADPNITKDSSETNDPDEQFDPPASKGGTKTRGGGYCQVRLDNRTAWFVKVYVDGIYRGTMSRYGDSVVFVPPGATRVYARAYFDDGSYYYWGPSNYSCGPGQYIYFRMNR